MIGQRHTSTFASIMHDLRNRQLYFTAKSEGRGSLSKACVTSGPSVLLLACKMTLTRWEVKRFAKMPKKETSIVLDPAPYENHYIANSDVSGHVLIEADKDKPNYKWNLEL